MNSLFSIDLGLYTYRQLLLVSAVLIYSSAFTQRQEPQIVLCDADSLKVLDGHVLIFLKQRSYQKAKAKAIKSQFEIVCSSKLLASDGFEIGENASLFFYKSDLSFPDNYDYGLAIWKVIEPIVARIPDGVWAESGWRYLNWGKSLYFVKIETEKRDYQFGFFDIQGKLAFSLFQCQKVGSNSVASLASVGANMQLTKPDPNKSRYVVNP